MRRTNALALLILLAILMVLGLAFCSRQARAQCPQPSGYCFAVQFIGFNEYDVQPLVYLRGGPAGYESQEIEHPELQEAYASVSWSPGNTCTNSFTYMDPYSDYGGVLFPPGSKYEKFQLKWNLLCADIKGCSTNPYFFDIRELEWGGRPVTLDHNGGGIIPNQTFTFNEHGQGPATLHVAEIVQLPNGVEVRGVRMELPGKRQVIISVTRQECP